MAGAAQPAAEPLSISIQAESSRFGVSQQLRLSGREGDAAFQALARRSGEGRDWVRWSASGGQRSGRWILGSVRGWNSARGPGWGDPLARRSGRPRPGPTLAAGARGVTWVAQREHERWTAGFGRGARGGAAGVLVVTRGAWTSGWELEEGAPRAVGGWAPVGSAGIIPRAEVAVERGRGELRFGLGGGRAAAGLIVEALAEPGRSTDWRGEVGSRAGEARFRASLRRAAGRIRSDLSADWERPFAGGSVRLVARHRVGLETTLAATPSRRARVALRAGFGGPRSRRYVAWSSSGQGRHARYGLRLEAPARSPRRGSGWISVGRAATLRLGADWRGGRAPSWTVTWTGGRN